MLFSPQLTNVAASMCREKDDGTGWGCDLIKISGFSCIFQFFSERGQTSENSSHLVSKQKLHIQMYKNSTKPTEP